MPKKQTDAAILLLFICSILLLSGADVLAAESAPIAWPDLSSDPKSEKGSSADAALVIGISDYIFLDKVEGAVSNADDWREYLRQSKNIARQNIGFLTDKEATDNVIRREATRIAKLAKPGSTIWFVFVGHGAASSDGETGLLVGVDAQASADGLDSRSVRQTDIEAIFNKSQASRVVMIVDACFSGRTSEGKPLAPGLQALVRPTQLKAKNKTILMTAAKSDQFAGPLPGAHRPAFSYLLLGALRGWGDENHDKNVTAEEAMDYVRGVFVSLVRGRSQTPELTASNKQAILAANVSEEGPDIDAMVRQKIKKDAPPAKPVQNNSAQNSNGEYIQIPAGTFVLSHDTARYYKGIKLSANAFALKKTPVTVAEFQKCVAAGKCSNKNFDIHDPDKPYDGRQCNYNRGAVWNNHPMNCVDWYGAKDYCEWIGGRMLTEEEWEYAATHNGKTHLNAAYPWGDSAPDASKANYGQSTASGSTSAVGKYSPAGDSPLGLVDMSGNVWEWTSELKAEKGNSYCTVKGGSWAGDVDYLRVTYNGYATPPTNRNGFIGFRCAK